MGPLFLLFIALPLLDLALLARLGRVFGALPTLAFVIGVGALGVSLARSRGRRILRGFQDALAAGQVPERSVLDGVLSLVGAVLLIVPGVISDALGLLLLIPLSRAALARLMTAHLQRQIAQGSVRVYGVGMPPRERPETEVGRAQFRPGEVIDTQGEEVKE